MSTSLKCARVRLFSFLLVVIATVPVMAQSVRGAIGGSVTDTTGALIPNATITATNQDTGGKNTTHSTGAGVYSFPDLPIGPYTVTVSANGFQTKTSTGVLVTVNSTIALNVSLGSGPVNEVVTVDASGLQLQTESSDIGGTISNKQVEDLPLSLASGVGGLRSPETFVFLIPGTTGPGSGTSGNTGNGVFFSRLSGGQAYGAEVLLDGASIQRSENGSSFDETSPSIEALQEFKVTTSAPSAEFGRTTSGIESFSTKSGTNEFHGIAYAIVKNRIFDANNWFNDGYKVLDCAGVSEVNCAYSKPQDSKYDYGGVFSGPVWIPHLYNGHDKTFFTFAWEKYQYRPGTVIVSTVPTAAERGGDFSDILGGYIPGGSSYNGVNNILVNPCNNNMPVLYNQIYDPSTTMQASPGVFCRTPLSGNQIPTNYLSPTAQKLVNGLPLPNQTPQSTDVFGYIGNYAQTGVSPNNNTTYTIRIDQNLGQRSKIFGSYNTRQNFKLTAAPDFPEPFNNSGYVQTFTTHYGRAGWDYNITPTLLNHLNLGYNRTNSVNLSSEFMTSDTAAAAGLANDYSKFFPTISFPSPDAPSNWGQQQNGINIDNGIRVNDVVTWVKGRNNIRMGVDYRNQRYSTNLYNVDNFNFYRDQSAGVSNTCCGSGNPFASFLMGEVGQAGQTVYNVNPRWKSWYIAGFIQDDIKVTSNLTINAGLRYSIDNPRHEALNRTSNFSFTAPDAAAGGLPGALVFGTTCGNCNTAWADTWYKDIAPRVGFAYVLPGTHGKAALRGGAAIIYGPLQYNDFGGSMLQGYNISKSVALGGTATQGGAFTPAFRLDSASPADPQNSNIGFPNYSYAPNTDPTQLTAQNGPGSFQAVAGDLILPRDGRPSMTSNWSLQLQDQIAQDLIFSIGYIGEVAQDLRSGFLTNFNNIDTKYFGLGDLLSNSQYNIPLGGTSNGYAAPYSTFTGPIGQSLRPFPQYDYIADDCCLENLGHSSYHALVTSLERRFRNGLNLQASYTWSKTLTDADSLIPFSYTSNNQREQAQYSTNLKGDKAVSVQDLTNQFSLSYLYELPFGEGRRWANHSRGLDLLVGGWEVGAIQRYSSGQPIGFGCATGIPYYQNCITFDAGPASLGGKTFASSAYQANKNGPSVFNGESWFKPAYRVAGTNGANDPGVPMSQAAFVDQNREGVGWARPYSPNCGTSAQPCSFAPFALGNLARVTEAITGPRYLAEDISLLKNFHITKTVTFQMKGEAFDLFNRHRMALPDLAPNDSSQNTGFGIPTAVDYGPRNMQLTGKIIF
ncbi:carboxypeptidase-like regulatory domain-containing protein [Granulicella sp. 5B5]|uniref:TonB-dependent receptor n=1 Tax=Granulicella sp. 5B5 TaxID=1617967 RepID=UPI0015F3EE0A|nr:carboxypeptidase-like regulatory domain-containing protein [Granulicella sp. 5B5]